MNSNTAPQATVQEADLRGELSRSVDRIMQQAEDVPMNVNDWERIGSLVFGVAVLLLLARRLLAYLLVVAIGAYLVMRGLTGYCHLYGRANLSTRRSSSRDARADDKKSTLTNEERDIVEEASWESFPASDPPAYNH